MKIIQAQQLLRGAQPSDYDFPEAAPKQYSITLERPVARP